MPYFMLLVKVFSDSRYADEFIRGKLYARRLSHFKHIEDADGRGDEYEGAILRDITRISHGFRDWPNSPLPPDLEHLRSRSYGTSS